MCGNTTTSRSGSSGRTRDVGGEGRCGHGTFLGGYVTETWGAGGADQAASTGQTLRGERRGLLTAPLATFGGSAKMSSGLPSPAIVASSTTTFCDVGERRQVVHDVEQRLLEDRAQARARRSCGARAPCLRDGAAARARGTRARRLPCENIFWYCFTSAFFGSIRILISAPRRARRASPPPAGGRRIPGSGRT